MDNLKGGTVSVGIEVDTSQVDDAIEKAGELRELTQHFAPVVMIKGARDCVFHIHASRNDIGLGGVCDE